MLVTTSHVVPRSSRIVIRPSFLISSPFLYHVTVGGGTPENVHGKRTVWALGLATFSGSEVAFGGTEM